MKHTIIFAAIVVAITLSASTAAFGVGGAEFTGQFEPGLVANESDFEKVIFKFTLAEQIRSQLGVSSDARVAVGKLIDPQLRKYAVLSYIVEDGGRDPVIFVDLNGDGTVSADEKLILTKLKADNPYLWHTTAELVVKDGPFKTLPIGITYLKSIRMDNMGPEERLVTQTTDVLARGTIDVNGKKVLVEYSYDPQKRKVDPQNGWLGVDADGDGEVDLDALSPEATKADNETIVFRVGDTYISTKKADIGKNQIILRQNEAKEYKRAELYMGKEFPEFAFTDFDGKKHKFSEYRGKYVLLDIWGFWCGPCKRELPYLREAFRRFSDRDLTIVGLNTDENYTIDSMKKGLVQAGMGWTQAQMSSVANFLREGIRVNSFPTTFLISPEGKILSMARSRRDEPDLRGRDLLDTLDGILPKKAGL